MITKHTRETVELVTGETYSSDDHWVRVWKLGPIRQTREHRSKGWRNRSWSLVTNKGEADRIRYIALVAHGGGRDDVDRRGEGAGPLGRNAKKGGAK